MYPVFWTALIELNNSFHIMDALHHISKVRSQVSCTSAVKCGSAALIILSV